MAADPTMAGIGAPPMGAPGPGGPGAGGMMGAAPMAPPLPPPGRKRKRGGRPKVRHRRKLRAAKKKR